MRARSAYVQIDFLVNAAVTLHRCRGRTNDELGRSALRARSSSYLDLVRLLPTIEPLIVQTFYEKNLLPNNFRLCYGGIAKTIEKEALRIFIDAA